MSKLADFLDSKKIDRRRLLQTSRRIEALRPEDRAIKLATRRAKGSDAKDADKELAAKARRGGRAVSAPTLNAALRGDKVVRGAKLRIIRAVNAVLTSKKQTEVGAGDLFE